MRIKKVIVGLVCLFLISTCGFEIPESIVIKGEPGLYIPLGSPFANLNPEYRLENIISPEKIREKMNEASDTENIEIYEVSSEMVKDTLGEAYKDTLTYMVEYQLADIPLNLQEYMDKAMNDIDNPQKYNIPDLTKLPEGIYYIGGENGPSLNENKADPFLRIPLDDMVKFVNWVTRDLDDMFGLAISEIDTYPWLANLEIKIPALGINKYIKGNPKKNKFPNKLLFVDTATTNDQIFEPNVFEGYNNELWIYARISSACTGGTIEPEIVFEWQKAEINTEDNEPITGTYKIGNSLEDFPGLSFKTVLGYMYISGVNESKITSDKQINMKVTFGYNGISHERDLKFIDTLPYTVDQSKKTVNKTVDKGLNDSSFKDPDTNPLELASIFTSNYKDLYVEFNIQTWVITNDGNFKETIQCKLCVLIPLDLKVSEVDGQGLSNSATDKNGNKINQTYVPLDLGMGKLSLYENEDDDAFDLFNRVGDEDNIIDTLKNVEIILKDIDITILDPKNLAVLIERQGASQSKDYKLLEFFNKDNTNSDEISLTLEKDFIRRPFNPKFTILLKKDEKTPGTYENFGSFSISRPDLDNAQVPNFDFKLYVKAQAALEFTKEL